MDLEKLMMNRKEVINMEKNKLFYQFYKGICLAFNPGCDKHSYKRSGCRKVKIFGYEDRRNIIKIANQLSNYLTKNHPEINKIKEITANEVTDFLLCKNNYCSKNTMKNYQYGIKKLERICNEHLYLNVKLYDTNLNLEGITPYIRDIEMSDNDLDILLNEIKNSNSKAKLGIELLCYFGLRVSEICKLKGQDISLENMTLHVHESKGKRSRDLAIDSLEKLEVCKKVVASVKRNERVCPLRHDSVNAEIRRILVKNKITKYKEHKTGVHSIRKSVAKKELLKILDETGDMKVAEEATATMLGHGKKRKDIINTYVKW